MIAGRREPGVAPTHPAKWLRREIELRRRRIFTELIPMPDIQVDRFQMAPLVLPSDIPELSDDECLACLARAVETHDSARLDEVAALIGRLAVTIE